MAPRNGEDGERRTARKVEEALKSDSSRVRSRCVARQHMVVELRSERGGSECGLQAFKLLNAELFFRPRTNALGLAGTAVFAGVALYFASLNVSLPSHSEVSASESSNGNSKSNRAQPPTRPP